MFSTIYGESSSASLSDVVFGCGHENYGKPQLGTGVLGLGSGKFSLVHRFGSKFSYCFGNLNDLLNPYNVLAIGDSGDTLGYTTQLEIENGLYYVKVEAISMGGSLLPIEPWVFQRKRHTYASCTIIDTGTSLTMLAREAYEPLKERIEDIFDGRFEIVKKPVNGKYYRECYKGVFERDLLGSGFPLLTFHFSDGAELLSLDVKAMFSSFTPDLFCLNVIETHARGLNVIGATAQQNHNVGYDFEAHTVTFERIDCGYLYENRLQK